MSDNDWDPTQDDDQDSGAVKALRAQVKKLEKELGQFRQTARDSEVNKVLAKLPEGKREKAKRLIGDSDPKEWLEEFGDLFAGSDPETPTAEADAPAEQAVPDAGALQDISAATQGGNAPDFETRFGQQTAQVNSAAELDNLIKSLMK